MVPDAGQLFERKGSRPGDGIESKPAVDGAKDAGRGCADVVGACQEGQDPATLGWIGEGLAKESGELVEIGWGDGLAIGGEFGQAGLNAKRRIGT